MQKFYHQANIEIIPQNNFKTYDFKLDIPATYGFNYYKKLDEEIKEFFNTIENTNYPILFQIKGDFDLLSDADEEEKIYFIVAVTNIFVSHMIEEGSLEREKRLSAPKSLDSLNLNFMTKKDLVNKKIKFPTFSLVVKDKSNKIIYEVFKDESTSINTD